MKTSSSKRNSLGYYQPSFIEDPGFLQLDPVAELPLFSVAAGTAAGTAAATAAVTPANIKQVEPPSLPNSIRAMLVDSIKRINTFNLTVSNWRVMDKKHHSQGRYEADCFLSSSHDDAKAAMSYINKFLDQCKLNGFDGQKLLAELGFQHIISISDEAYIYINC